MWSTDCVLKTIQWEGSENHAARPDLRWLKGCTRLSLLLVNCRARTDPPDNIPGIPTHCQTSTLWSHTEEVLVHSLINCSLNASYVPCMVLGAEATAKNETVRNPSFL